MFKLNSTRKVNQYELFRHTFVTRTEIEIIRHSLSGYSDCSIVVLKY